MLSLLRTGVGNRTGKEATTRAAQNPLLYSRYFKRPFRRRRGQATPAFSRRKRYAITSLNYCQEEIDGALVGGASLKTDGFFRDY